MNNLPQLLLNKIQVRSDKVGNICLTDLFKGSGKDRNYNPNEWLRQDSTQRLIETAAAFLNTGADRIIITKRGKGGGTYTHKQIALAYAKYLSPELHILVNQAFFELQEEQQNPEIALDRAIRDWKKQGKSEEWISTRLRSKFQRNEFTTTLKQHGVTTTSAKDNGYRLCTNAIYYPLLGGDTKSIRQQKGLPEKANVRDSLGAVELAAVMLSEAMSAENIKSKNLHGNRECATECKSVSLNIAHAVGVSRTTHPLNIG